MQQPHIGLEKYTCYNLIGLKKIKQQAYTYKNKTQNETYNMYIYMYDTHHIDITSKLVHCACREVHICVYMYILATKK